MERSEVQGQQKITIELFLIRHGMTVYNRDRRYLGRTDLPICEQGMEDLMVMKQTQPTLYSDIDLLFVSPMLRCRQTADILYPDRDGIIIDEWKEMDFGIFEGRTADEMAEDTKYRKWVDSGCEDPIPGGESRQDFNARNLAGLKRCLSIVCRDSKNNSEPKEDEKPVLISVSSINSSVNETDGDLLYDRMNDRWLALDTYNKSVCTITAAAVVHAGTIMSIVSALTGKEYYDCYVKNGEGYRLMFVI